MLLIQPHIRYISSHIFKDWGNASALARALQIGAKESQAVSNLQSRTDKGVLDRLKSAVERRGLRQFLTHDALAQGIFNLGFSSAVGASESWQAILTNCDDNRVVPWLELLVYGKLGFSKAGSSHVRLFCPSHKFV